MLQSPSGANMPSTLSYESTPESVDDARYTVHHLGGETEFAVN